MWKIMSCNIVHRGIQPEFTLENFSAVSVTRVIDC